MDGGSLKAPFSASYLGSVFIFNTSLKHSVKSLAEWLGSSPSSCWITELMRQNPAGRARVDSQRFSLVRKYQGRYLNKRAAEERRAGQPGV